MMVEVIGIGLPNRGAELMLSAVIEQFKSRGVEANFVVEPLGEYVTRAKYQLFQKSRFFVRGKNLGWPFSCLPKFIRDKYGIVNSSEVDLVIDASGFTYGDRWGASIINYRLASQVDYFKKRGVKMVMLPQAFGSFDDLKVAKYSRCILKGVDLVIARDKISHKHVVDLNIPCNLKLYPDFTNLIEPIQVSKYSRLDGRPCIIPNYQMIKHGGGGDYKGVLASAIKGLKMQGENPYILIHEGLKDYDLAVEISSSIEDSIEIIDPKDALAIKSIISKSSLVVGSRYHGLVSALSCGVPVVAMGWSHKYQMLLEDYGVPELLSEVDANAVSALVSRLTVDKEYRLATMKKISDASIEQKRLTREMWDLVFGFILGQKTPNADRKS